MVDLRALRRVRAAALLSVLTTIRSGSLVSAAGMQKGRGTAPVVLVALGSLWGWYLGRVPVGHLRGFCLSELVALIEPVMPVANSLSSHGIDGTHATHLELRQRHSE